MKLVLDACAIVAWFREESGGAVVQDLVESGVHECSIHVVNLCEVYYDCLKTYDEDRAESIVSSLVTSKVELRDDLDGVFWGDVSHLKSQIHRISLADCFAIALTKRLEAELVTTDHHELDRVAEQGICPIRFVR